jgi:hypothetical protein
MEQLKVEEQAVVGEQLEVGRMAVGKKNCVE